MKKTWKIYGISVILALLVNLAIFFVVPLIQILFGTVRQDKPILRDKLYRQANVYLPPKQKIQEKPVEQLKPMQMMTKTKVSPLPRSFTIDLSAAGEVRSSSVAGKGNGTPGGQGLGVMVYNPGETDTDADLIRGQTKPKHPLRAEREDVSGYVEVGFIVNESGFAEQAQILLEDPKGYGFGKEALKWLSTVRFHPATLQGVSVPQKAKLPISFNLE